MKLFPKGARNQRCKKSRIRLPFRNRLIQRQVRTVDLKNGSASIQDERQGKADAAFAFVDQDAFDFFEGKLNPRNAFMQGKMKIKGNMQSALKFTPDLFPKPKL